MPGTRYPEILADLRVSTEFKALWKDFERGGLDPGFFTGRPQHERPVRYYHLAKENEPGVTACGITIPPRSCVYFNSEKVAQVFGFERCSDWPR